MLVSSGFSPVLRLLCLVGLAAGLVGVCVAVVIGLIDPAKRVWTSTPVTVDEVKSHLAGRGTKLDDEIDGLRPLLQHFDDAGWGAARSLIVAWVHDYGVSRDEKLQFVSEMKRIGSSFPPERRAEALDAFRTLKQDKVVSSARSVERWLGRVGAIQVMFGALLLVGVFCVAAAVLDHRRSV